MHTFNHVSLIFKLIILILWLNSPIIYFWTFWKIKICYTSCVIKSFDRDSRFEIIDLLVSFPLFKLFALSLRLINNSNLCCLSNWLEMLYISRFLLHGFINIYFSNYYNENDAFSFLCQSAVSLFNYGYVLRCLVRVMVSLSLELNFLDCKASFGLQQYGSILYYANKSICTPSKVHVIINVPFTK